MAVVINEARESHNAPPQNFPDCKEFMWEIGEFEQKESMPNPVQSAEDIDVRVWGLSAGLVAIAIVGFISIIFNVYHCVKGKNAQKRASSVHEMAYTKLDEL